MIRAEFWRSVLPSMVAFAFSGIYAIVDGMFVGRSVGDVGLAAVNIAYPLTALVQAVGTGLGMAGAIGLSISLGRSDEKSSRRYLGNSLILLLAAGGAATLLLFFLSAPLLQLFGAQGEVLALSRSYMRYIALGALVQILGTGLVPILRACGGAMAAMSAMAVGFSSNVLLDWLLVSAWGLETAGAAIATVLAQTVTGLLCLRFLLARQLLRQAKFRLEREPVCWLLATALSPFGLTLSPNITTILLNRASLQWGGQPAVAAFAVVSYTICVAQLLLQGIGDGAQPLLGRYHGGGDRPSLAQVRRLMLLTSPAAALGCMALLFLCRTPIPLLFGASPHAAALFVQVLPWFLCALLFLSFGRSFTSYFYATDKPRLAYLLIYGEPLLLTLSLLLLPRVWGLNGVWMAVPAVQVLLALIGLTLLIWSERRHIPSLS